MSVRGLVDVVDRNHICKEILEKTSDPASEAPEKSEFGAEVIIPIEQMVCAVH